MPVAGATRSGFSSDDDGSPWLDQRATVGVEGTTPTGRSDTRPWGCRASHCSSSRPSAAARCTVGTLWKSSSSEPRVSLTSTMPTPSARLTARDLSTRPTAPRSQSTIRSATARASRLPGFADPGRLRRRAWGRHASTEHQSRRTDRTGRHHGAGQRLARVAHDPALAQWGGGAADGGHPGARVGGVRRGAVVAGCGDDDDIGLGGAQQGPLDGVEVVGSADRRG